MSAKRARIALDGPAGTGKSTVSKQVARELGYTYVDTGAMYRAVAWLAAERGYALDEEDALVALAEANPVSFAHADEGGQRVLVAGEDVTEAIRTPEISRLASPVSAIPGVRTALVRQQQTLGAAGAVVMEGRDIQTVVMPDAEVKVFLTASPEERARRRTLELEARGTPQPFQEVLAEMTERDHRDSSRAVAPLAAAADATVIDTEGLTVDQVVARVVKLARAAEVCGETD